MLPPIPVPLNPAPEPPLTFEQWALTMIKLVKQYGEASYDLGIDNSRFQASALLEQSEGAYRAVEAHIRRRLTG